MIKEDVISMQASDETTDKANLVSQKARRQLAVAVLLKITWLTP